jgi:putative ABC transport system ATP-binding protein
LSIISVYKVILEYKKGESILKGVSVDIEKGTFNAIVGPSGSGKSTLLNIMSGLLKPTKGKVLFDNKDITKFSDKEISDLKRNRIGMVFQNYYLLSYLTIEENIKVGLSPNGDNFSVDELAKLLGIADILKAFPTNVSGGQQQRAAIARAVIKKPDVLFCDEATGALDEENSKKVISLLHHIQKSMGITVVFITHNHEIAKTAHRIITIKNGEIFKDEINPNPINVEQMVWA